MKWIVGLALVCSLAACASSAEWAKDGVSHETAAQDLADCRSDAQAATRRDTNIETDIMASRGRDWHDSGAFDTKQATFAAENQGTQKDVITRCMIGKGYAPGA